MSDAVENEGGDVTRRQRRYSRRVEAHIRAHTIISDNYHKSLVWGIEEICGHLVKLVEFKKMEICCPAVAPYPVRVSWV